MAYSPRDLASLHGALLRRNASRWDEMVELPQWVSLAQHVVDKIVANKARYELVSSRTSVPWELVGVIHDREASLSWLANIANGDPWNKRTIHEPSLRGPFKSWEDAAEDALLRCPPFAGRWSDWSTSGALTLLELYNGVGYANMGLPSPYIWSGTNQYTKGKFVADHHFDPDAVDHQLGCAIMLSQIYKRSPRDAVS